MPTVPEQNEAKVGQNRRQGLFDAFSQMGIIVAVDGHHRALDLLAKRQQLSALSQLCGLTPHLLMDLVLNLQDLRLEGHWLVSVGLGKQFPQLGQRRAFVSTIRLFQDGQ